MENNKDVEIKQLREDGLSVMDIASSLDIPIEVVANKLHQEGAIGTKTNFLDSENNKLIVIQMKESGMKTQDIAEDVGLSVSAVSRFLRKVTHQEWWDKREVGEATKETKEDVNNMSNNTQGTTGSKMDLADDETKVLVKKLKEEGKSYKDIAENTGVSYHNVRNFLLKKTYKEWWENDTPDVDDNYKGLTTEANKLLAIKMSTVNNASVSDIAEVIGVNAKAIEKFLDKKTYKSWWDKYEAKLEEAAEEAENAVDSLLNNLGENIEEALNEIEEEDGTTLDRAKRASITFLAGCLLAAAIAVAAVVIL